MRHRWRLAMVASAFLLVPDADAFKPTKPKKDLRQLAVVDLLRQIWFAQEYQKAHHAIDADGDLLGEYATLAELGSATPLRDSGDLLVDVLPPNPLGHELGDVDANGYVQRFGYYLALYLPDAAEHPTPEPAYGGTIVGVDTDSCELHWVVYAWPVGGKVQRPTFAMNQDGRIVWTYGDNGYYNGTSSPPHGLAAAVAGGDMTDPLITEVTASTDGNGWHALD